jgi:hypothetical protein
MISARLIQNTVAPALVALFALNLIMVQPVHAQSQAERRIEELKESVRKLEAIDRDKDISSGVKERNKRYLSEQREELRDLLVYQIKDLKAYKATAGDALNQRQNQDLDSNIAALEKDLSGVEAGMASGAPPERRARVVAIQPDQPQPSPQPVERMDEPVKKTRAAEPVPPPKPSPSPQAASGAGTKLATASPCSNNYATAAPPKLKEVARSAANIILQRKDADRISDFFHELTFYTLVDALANASASEARAQRILKSIQVQEETKRTDTQIGASARGAGSTSAAEKPNFARLLGIAIEHGAIQKEVNGTTLTLSTSPYALPAAGQGDTAETYQKYGGLSRVGLSASFNIQNKENPLESATGNQLSESSVKVRFTRDYSIRSKTFEDFFREQIAPKISAVAVVLTDALFETFKDDMSEQTRRVTLDKFIGAGGFISVYLTSHPNAAEADLQQEILCRLKEQVYDRVDTFNISELSKRRLLDKSLPGIAEAEFAETEARKEAEAKISEFSGRGVGTFAYTFKREPMGPDYSILQLLYQKNLLNSIKMVANVGSAFYHHPNHMMNQDNLRDVAVAVSFEGNLGRSPFLSDNVDKSQVTFALTGRYERMFENRHVALKKADLAVVQLKTEIPFGTGMSFPFSVTYANATELIKEDHVRVNFGFSFDASKFALLRKFLTSENP